MANVDSPFGLRWVGSFAGTPMNAAVRPCVIDSGYGTALFVGDPVVRVAGGSNSAVIKNTTGGHFEIGTLPSVERATVTDGGVVSGVIVGFAPSTQESGVSSAASTESVAYVCTDPYALYEIQADGAITATMIGLNAVGIYTHSGSTATGLSGLELDSGTTTAPSADASNPFTIVAQKSSPDNETNLIHNKVLVRINQSTDALGAIGI